jgi:hypothetical protein
MMRINQNHKYCDSTGFQKGFVLFISYLVFSVLLRDVYVCRPIYQPILSYMSLDISVSCLLTDYCVVIFRPYSRTKAEFFLGGEGILAPHCFRDFKYIIYFPQPHLLPKNQMVSALLSLSN